MKLFPYQEEGVKFLKERPSVLLADEPGLGKTAQTAVALDRRFPVLIVCPNLVKYFWAIELVRWGGYSPTEIAIYHRGDNYNPEFWKYPDVRVWIIHWEALRLNQNDVWRRYWKVIIADEAHRMKGRKTQQSKIIRSLQAETKYALTGTPIINRPDEIWAQLNFLFPKEYKSYWAFVNAYCATVPAFRGVDIVGFRDPAAFKKMLSRFMLRRAKETVLPQLPKKMYTNLPIDILPEQRKAYDQMKKDLIVKLKDDEVIEAANALAMLTRLRQIACGLHLVSTAESSAKLDEVTDLIEDMNQPVVVFSNFVGMVTELKARLAKKKITCECIFGEVPQDKREAIVKDFQSGKFQVIALTLATGGVGVTLTRAGTCIFLDKSWSPALQIQAEDRIHRLGQQASSVNIVSLIAKDTVEERMEKLLKYKEGLMGVITGKDLKELM
jgi:SNF2 family DNA or RNA helicase